MFNLRPFFCLALVLALFVVWALPTAQAGVKRPQTSTTHTPATPASSVTPTPPAKKAPKVTKLTQPAPSIDAVPKLAPKEEAVVIYNEGVRLFHASQDTSTQSIGESYRLRQNAKKAFKQALKLNPDLVEAHSNLGYIELTESHAKQAMPYFEKAVGLSPRHEASVAGWAMALHESAQSEKALALLTSLTQWYPETERHWFNLGTILQQQGQHEKAVDAYKNALLVNPKHPPSFFNLATLYHEAKQPQTAWTYYERCIQMDPGSALALQSQSRILLLEKSFPEALNTKPPLENK